MNTILFADIEGSVQLFRRLGDAQALAEVEKRHAVVRQAVAAQDGRVVKSIGDGLMAIFDRASNACAAAVGAQQAVLDMSVAAGAEPLRIRVGLHAGPVIITPDDCFGDAVNIAARLCAAANGGEIMMSAGTGALLSPAQQPMLRRLGSIALKGLADRVDVVDALWSVEANVTLLPQALLRQTSLQDHPRLEISHGAERWSSLTGGDRVTMGREAGQTVVTLDPRASRNHATIDARGHQWVLTDHSTNGTFVLFPGEDAIKLRRQELVLHGLGSIGFGFDPSEPNVEALRFTLFLAR